MKPELGTPEEIKTRYTEQQLRDHLETYQQAIFLYCLGVLPVRIATPAWMTKQEAAKARREVYVTLRERFPNRFPKGHRFS